MAVGDKTVLLQLAGNWKFSIGDDNTWANADFNDSKWETIAVPSAWEDQGFYGHDGYAWYRNEFTLTREMKTRELFITLGYINDVDQVFVNGHLVGFSGSFPPNYSSATDALRKYPIPSEFLNANGKNVIAVRVYNYQMSGGIVTGDACIFSYNWPKPDLSLAGMWLFRTGDNSAWKLTDCNDNQWSKIVVPGNWENQGYKDYDGIACYRKHFAVNDDITNQKMVIILGKINNSDEVYLNGVLIGATGKMPSPITKNNKKIQEVDSQELRVYDIPDGLLTSKKDNVVTIRVFDSEQKGGIIEGSIGLMKLANFKRFYKNTAHSTY